MYASAEVTLDVERMDSPVSLRVPPPSFHLQQGQSMQLSVIGVCADGPGHGLTRSSNLQMNSSNTAVATVQNGSVMATGVGNANIQISYESLTASAPVAVQQAQVQEPPKVTCAANPATLWPPNGSSVPATISGTITAGTSTINPAATTGTSDLDVLVAPPGVHVPETPALCAPVHRNSEVMA